MRWLVPGLDPGMSGAFRCATSDTRRPALVSDAERGLVLQAGGGFDETGHLVLAQNDRRLARLLHRRQMPDEVGPFERDLEEEPQRGAGLVDGRRADMLLGQMQLISAKVLGRRLIRRPAEENREVLHGADVVPLGVFA